jgi:MFS family permease
VLLGAVVWTALSYVVLYWVGVAGWRFGWILSLLMAGLALGVLVSAGLGRHFGSRGIWVAAAVIAGAVLSVLYANAAPLSTARLDQTIDQMGIHNELWQRISEVRMGHGWCSPQCPEVLRMYRSPNNSDAAALATALSGLHRIGLVKDVASAYVHQRGPTIVVGTSSRLRGFVTIGHLDSRVTLLVDLKSGR